MHISMIYESQPPLQSLMSSEKFSATQMSTWEPEGNYWRHVYDLASHMGSKHMFQTKKYFKVRDMLELLPQGYGKRRVKAC